MAIKKLNSKYQDILRQFFFFLGGNCKDSRTKQLAMPYFFRNDWKVFEDLDLQQLKATSIVSRIILRHF